MTAADSYPLLADFANRPSGHVTALAAKRREAREALDEIERLRAERVVADDIIRRLAAMDPRAFNSAEERICACCRGMQTHPDAVHPAGIVVVKHDDSWTGYGGKRHEATESIAHEPDCAWLACRQEDDR